jgi:dTDP-4-amino-4,6-dideoxygalactose transaminase
VFGDVDDMMCLKPDEGYWQLAIPVHLTGNIAFTDYTCPVIEDSAHRIDKDQCRDSQNLVCFSFYATKNMTTGEGGMIATNDKEAYDWLMQARHHGISKDGWNRYKKGGAWKYDIEFVGFKANQSDILAAIGIEQLKKLPDFDKRRRDIITIYNEAFGYMNDGLHLYPVLVKNRDTFIKEMAKANIQVSVHFLPVHKMTAYSFEQKLPRTEFLGEHLVSLPLYPSMTNREIDYVIDTAILTKQILPWGKTIY